MPLRRLDSLLVANRGEIAVRVARSARAHGLRIGMVCTGADRGALHARAGDLCVMVPDYLDGAALVEAARALPGVVGVHPGYGFLAERADFARQVEAAGLVWVGPPAEAIAAMGDKAAARRRVAEFGVPVVPGYDGQAQDDETLSTEAARIGWPLLVKAAAGGGGKGMQVVREPSELREALAAARRLARGAFGDDRLVLERYLSPARHVEVQVMADRHGATLHLFERECSLQRRHQKVIEEAPSPALSPEQRAALCADAVQAAQAVGYVGAGTVEFILGPDGHHHFLEMNTRLQVEHPVTELITGLDLVELQLSVAEGRPLPLSQDQVQARGWAIEARLYAEDVAGGWLPAAGPVLAWTAPPDLRVDAGVEAGGEVGTRYDPMLAKVVAGGADREQARRRLVQGLQRLVALGLTTNRGALIGMLQDPRFVAGELSTTMLEGFVPPAVPADWRALCAVVAAEQARERAGRPLPEVPAGWRNHRWRDPELALQAGGAEHRLRWRELGPGHLRIWRAPEGELVPAPAEGGSEVRSHPVDGGLWIEVDGVAEELPMVRSSAEWHLHRPHGDLRVAVLPAFPEPGHALPPGGLVAPMTGVVVSVAVAAGQVVQAGQALVVLEAMKMEQVVRAPHGGVVAEVRVAPGQQLDAGTLLVVLDEAGAATPGEEGGDAR
ncbi:ATP-grasp domain-containing protein [Myxococcota bacterium]|nr:ATP-grasp domain-containing protein [Myxococcota bacterium]